MAVNKVVNKSTKSHGAMRNVIEYVLQDKKVRDGYVEIIGPYFSDNITWQGVYTEFLAEKKLWNKDSGRMYAHNIISFHKDEDVTPEQCLEIGRLFVDRFFPEHQSLIGVHQDKDHLHIHIVTNSVSFIDGKKLHQTKKDLELQKIFTNDLCKELGLSVTEKGKHFDGSIIDEGEVVAWNKDKYNLLRNETKKSYVVDCAIAVLKSKENCCSKEEFISNMLQYGWQTIWTDKKKHITFKNQNGEKVRDTNLSKSFSLNINKEVLTHEFKRQNESRNKDELCKYYSEVEAVISGTGVNPEPVESYKEVTRGSDTNKKCISTGDTNTLIRKIKSDINDNRVKNRVARNSENKSVFNKKQRRLKREQRFIDSERTARTRR